ncbi:hypothetical protein ACIBSW_23990 [Actinoplanes sp. NPDC049668]|uniref:hypothetical protein n=1 Tax=unclassified Actinoplanes TaxID=2626549 RepID=UPI0033AF537A
MRRARAIVATLVAVMFSASGSLSPLAGIERVTAELVLADRRPVLPTGWRWESYGGVQVGVPARFGWADSGLRLGAWCIDPPDDESPVVARPGGGVPAIACLGDGTRIAATGWVVGLDHALEPGDGLDRERDRTTVRLAGVEVVVQAPVALRELIAGTIHRVDVDAFGCPARHPISTRPTLRPARPVDVAALREVSAVSVCKYELRAADAQPWLVSGLRLDGAAADRAIQRIARAPVGGGPDNPQDCAPEVAYGDDVIVLRVRSAAGATEIVLRYSGCVGNGFDDGIAVRRLTAAAVAPFITGPGAVYMFSGREDKAAMLVPDFRPGG